MIRTNNSVLTPEKEHDVLILDEMEQEARIMLINDDHNSLDYVIDCLIKYCKHTTEQATQCAYIVHNNGQYAIKQGAYDKLLPIKEALCDSGLLAEID